MDVNKDNLKVTTNQGVEIEKDLNRGKGSIQEKQFHLEEFVDDVVSSYEDDSTSDEYFNEDYKDRWICKNKNRFQTKELDQTVVKDLIINNKQDVAEGQLQKAKYWTEQLVHGFFQEQNQEAKKSSIFSINNFLGISDPNNR